MVSSTNQIKQIAQKYAKNLQKKGINPLKIFLYGSYAQGTPNKWSDLDFIVISSDFKKYSYLQKLILLSQASANFKESIEAFGYLPEEISNDEKTTTALWDIVRKTSRNVYSK